MPQLELKRLYENLLVDQTEFVLMLILKNLVATSRLHLIITEREKQELIEGLL